MRMWMVNPEIMCDRHLLGEHVECHMLLGCMLKRKSLRGYVDKGLVELDKVFGRHKVLAQEMKARGFNHSRNHSSPMHFLTCWIAQACYNSKGKVDLNESVTELFSRCPNCLARFKGKVLKNGGVV